MSVLNSCNNNVKNKLKDYCSSILNKAKSISKTLSDKEDVSLLEDLN